MEGNNYANYFSMKLNRYDIIYLMKYSAHQWFLQGWPGIHQIKEGKL